MRAASRRSLCSSLASLWLALTPLCASSCSDVLALLEKVGGDQLRGVLLCGVLLCKILLRREGPRVVVRWAGDSSDRAGESFIARL
jgi:hypothetical protein